MSGAYVPRQFRGLENLRPWQEQMLAVAGPGLNILVDNVGNTGKTALAGYVHFLGRGRRLPYLDSYAELVFAVEMSEMFPLYIFDIPRALAVDGGPLVASFLENVEALQQNVLNQASVWVYLDSKPPAEFLL